MKNNNQDSEDEFIEIFSDENISIKNNLDMKEKISFKTKVKNIYSGYLIAYKSLPVNKISTI